MNYREEKFGVEAIKTNEQSSERRDGSVEVDSPEALMQFGTKVQEKILAQDKKVRADTDAEVNEVVSHFVASSGIPASEMAELRKPVDREIQESFGKMDRAALIAKEGIDTAAGLQ